MFFAGTKHRSRVGGDGVSALDVNRPRCQHSLYSAGVATTGDVMLDAGYIHPGGMDLTPHTIDYSDGYVAGCQQVSSVSRSVPWLLRCVRRTILLGCLSEIWWTCMTC